MSLDAGPPAAPTTSGKRDATPPTEGVSEPAVKSDVPAPAEPPRFPEIAGFKILSKLGAGAMGHVYKARQHSVNRVVAIKILTPEGVLNPAHLARVKSEGEHLARLRHPNIVQIHEAGVWEDRPYLVLEFVDGWNLAERLLGKPVDPVEAAQVMETIARAVDAAHQAGIVHRDLKPANILMEGWHDSLRECVPKITDFHLAKSLMHDSGMTQSGAVMGTPSYMAPEQVGEAATAGPETDVYALGVILYEMLTGRPPFRGVTPLDTLQQVLTHEPPPPTQILPEIPQDVEIICLKALEKEPQRRFRTAADFADELRRYSTGQAILSRPVSTLERIWRWCRRNRTTAILSAAAVASLLIGTIVSTVFGLRAIDSANKASTAAANATAQARRADGEAVRAEQEADAARTSEAQARAEQLTARRNQYAAEMTLLRQAFEQGDLRNAQALLDKQIPKSPDGVDLRGPEWHYWNRLFHRALRTLRGHTRGVRSLAFHPNGVLIATAGYDQTVRVWNSVTGAQLLEFAEHQSLVTDVEFQPLGELVASGEQGGQVYVWDLSGEVRREIEIRSLDDPEALVRFDNLTFTNDGVSLITTSSDRIARIWSIETGEMRTAGSMHGAIAVHPNQPLLASLAGESIVLTRFDTSAQVFTYPAQARQPLAVSFDQTGTRLVCGQSDGRVEIWEVPDLTAATDDVTALANEITRQLVVARGGEVLREGFGGWQGHAILQQITGAAFSPDGTHVAAAGYNKLLQVWNAASGDEVYRISGHTGALTCLAYSPDGRRIATGAYDWEERLTARGDQVVHIWDASAGQEPIVFALGSGLQSGPVRFSRDSTLLAAAAEQAIVVFDMRSRRRVARLQGHIGDVSSLEFASGNASLISGSTDGTIRVWDLTTQETENVIGAPIEGNDQPGVEVAVTADGSRLVSGSLADSRLTLWDAQTGEQLQVFDTDTLGTRSIDFDEEGTLIAAGVSESIDVDLRAQRVQIWNVELSEITAELVGHQQAPVATIHAIDFSSDGGRIVTASSDHTARVWDLTTAEELRRLIGHSSSLFAARFSGDGTRVVTCAFDGTVRLWDVETGLEVLALSGRHWQVVDVDISPDNSYIAAAFNDGTVRVWDLRPWTATSRDELEAHGLVTFYRSQGLDADALAAAVDADPTITEAVRTAARSLLNP